MSFLYMLIAAVAYIADRVTKAWAAGALRSEHGGCLPLIDGVFYFTYCENRGAAFSMMWGQTWLLVGVTSLICIAGIYLLFFGRRRLPVFPSVCIAMAVGGALGNLYDRALLGYVIDMLDFRLINFAVFNRYLFPGQLDGMFFTLFAIAIAAAETAVAIAIIINVYRIAKNVDINQITKLKF